MVEVLNLITMEYSLSTPTGKFISQGTTDYTCMHL